MGKDIFIWMPTLWSLDTKMALFLYELLKTTSHNFTIFHTVRQDIVRARNNIIKEFLKTDCEYLLFLDDDNIPDSIDFIDRMLEARKHIISALIPTRTLSENGNHLLCIFYENTNGYWEHQYWQYTNIPNWDLTEIANCGMGCVMIKRNVIEDISKKYVYPCMMWEYWYYQSGAGYLREDDIDIYKLEEGRLRFKRFMSEDLLFFERCRWLGYKIYAHKNVTCSHIWENKIITVKNHIWN